MKIVFNTAGKEIYQQTIEKLDYAIASFVNFEIYERVQRESKIIEVLYKAYICGVLTENKEIRIETLKKVKENCKILSKQLKTFKIFWKEHQEEKEKNEKSPIF